MTAAPTADHNRQIPACHACPGFCLATQAALQCSGWLLSKSNCPVISPIHSRRVIIKIVVSLSQRITFSVREGACCLLQARYAAAAPAQPVLAESWSAPNLLPSSMSMLACTIRIASEDTCLSIPVASMMRLCQRAP